jgi:hypothetical protein
MRRSPACRFDGVLTFMVQLPVSRHASSVSVLAPLLSLLLAALVGGLLLGALQVLVPRLRRLVRSRKAQRRRLRAAWGAEIRARAMMDELCPYGWHAQITLGESGDQHQGSTPGARARVALEWTAHEADPSQTSVVRRVYAPSINEALDAMVADRSTDETLERIERGSLGDGERWPDR